MWDTRKSVAFDELKVGVLFNQIEQRPEHFCKLIKLLIKIKWCYYFSASRLQIAVILPRARRNRVGAFLLIVGHG